MHFCCTVYNQSTIILSRKCISNPSHIKPFPCFYGYIATNRYNTVIFSCIISAKLIHFFSTNDMDNSCADSVSGLEGKK